MNKICHVLGFFRNLMITNNFTYRKCNDFIRHFNPERICNNECKDVSNWCSSDLSTFLQRPKIQTSYVWHIYTAQNRKTDKIVVIAN